MDLGGRLLYVSPTFERMWGTSLAALYERTERFLDAVHPEDRARVAENMQSFRADIPADFTGAEIEYRLLHPNGDMRWVRVRAFPVRDAQNQIFRMGGLIDDITEQKAVEAALIRALDDLERRVHERTAELLRSNESLRVEATERKRAESALRESETRLREQFSELENLYRHAPIGLCLHDTEMRYVRINERLAAINGHPASAHIGRTLGEMAPEMEATVGPIIRRVLETGESALDIELQSPAAAEPEITRSWLTSYYPLTSSDGRTLGVSAVVQDISEIKWAEDRARQHLENLAHVSRLSTMGQMATGLAHEINQPLATITNYAFAGRRKLEKSGTVDTAEIHQLFDDLLMQALRAGEIVQHLRAFVNKAPQRRTTTSVNTLIRDVLDLMESQFRLNDVRPVPTLDAGTVHVSADAIQIQQVIVNLIRNALDAMATVPPRDRQLAITSTCADKRIEVAVRDSGTGLSSDELAHVFEAFYSTKGEGMGMGLAISRSIIEAHGGRLWAEANPNKGMVFRFTLPETRVDERKEV
jgi:PAS domain S-box-containing protein